MISIRSVSGGSEARRTAASRLLHTKWAWSGTVLWKDKQQIGLNWFISKSEKCEKYVKIHSPQCLAEHRVQNSGQREGGFRTGDPTLFPPDDHVHLSWRRRKKKKCDKSDTRREEHKVRMACGASILMWLEATFEDHMRIITWSRHPRHSAQEILELWPERDTL